MIFVKLKNTNIDIFDNIFKIDIPKIIGRDDFFLGNCGNDITIGLCYSEIVGILNSKLLLEIDNLGIPTNDSKNNLKKLEKLSKNMSGIEIEHPLRYNAVLKLNQSSKDEWLKFLNNIEVKECILDLL